MRNVDTTKHQGIALTPQEIAGIGSQIDQGEFITKIASSTGISYATIFNYFSDKIAERKRSYWENRDKCILKSFSRHGSLIATAKETGACWSSITRVLKKNHVKIPDQKYNTHARKHPIKEDYFLVIDTEEKAYFLGLFYADGCVFIKQNPKRKSSIVHSANISLQKKDRHIMLAFSRAVYGANRLRKIVYEDGRGQDAYRMEMRSKRICEDLIRLGCPPRKSLILEFPKDNKIPDHLFRHFLRGYFDGDGTVGIYGKNKTHFTWGIISSVMFVDGWRKHFGPIVGKLGNLTDKIRYHVVNYCGRDSFIRFRDYIYKDATIFFVRKHKIFFSI